MVRNIIILMFFGGSLFGQSTVDTLILSNTQELEIIVNTVESVAVTITGTGGTATLSNIPYNDASVLSSINGQIIHSFGSSGMTVSGQSITFNNTLLGYEIKAEDVIIFIYQYTQ